MVGWLDASMDGDGRWGKAVRAANSELESYRAGESLTSYQYSGCLSAFHCCRECHARSNVNHDIGNFTVRGC